MRRSWARFVRFVFDNSLLLVVGTVAAVTWANLDTAAYDQATHPPGNVVQAAVNPTQLADPR